MNTLNRILVVLAVLVAIPACVAFFIAPVPILHWVGEQARLWADWLLAQPPLLRIAVGVLFALAWFVICVFVLVLELRRPRAKTVRVEKVGGGEVEVSLRTVADRVAYDVDQLPGVVRTRPRVSVRRRGVVVEVEVDMAGAVEVPERASRIVEVVSQAVEERVGVKLAQPPKVRLRAAPVPASPVRRPPSEG